MKFLVIPLHTDRVQRQRLEALQQAFAQVCNALALVVQESRCWNRVALHHMMYKSLRSQFPAMGSQMVCNAIYSVCRASRLIYQGEKSPFNVHRLGDAPLPLLRFADNCPVYFDRHTLSIRGGQLSMYTLDGRLRFELALAPKVESLLLQGKLHEIVLSRQHDGNYQLRFLLNEMPEPADAVQLNPAESLSAAMQANPEWPEYIVLDTSHD